MSQKITNGMEIENYCFNRSRFKLTTINLLSFETKSFLGRLFFSRKPLLNKNEANLLHLGCGSKKLEGWINADFFRDLKFWKKGKNRPDWMLDLRYPLDCEDNVWDGVFSEHTLEHLYPDEVLKLLKELRRTMKPNSWLRISVPDLEKYIDYYKTQDVPEEFLIKKYGGCEAIAYLTQNYKHCSVWDNKLLESFLQKAGFINIQQVSFRKGNNEKLLKDSKTREWESLYIECQKPTS